MTSAEGSSSMRWTMLSKTDQEVNERGGLRSNHDGLIPKTTTRNV
ncbi:hypothetical protein RRSWK_04466 [Rhodopirellula sp. SWK7]|nr:hypothetical protein RRSWK_04466 [Rhodopirellula sp. SWK7]